MKTLLSTGLLFAGLTLGQQNSVLTLSTAAPSLPANAQPTFQTLYSSPGVVLQAGNAKANGGATNALQGIFFDFFNSGSMASRAVIAGRSNGNWGELSFHTQYGGDGKLYERMRIDSAGKVGIGTTAPGSMLTVAGAVQSTAYGFIFPDGTKQSTATAQGPRGLQGTSGLQGPVGPQGPTGPAAPLPNGVNVNLAFNLNSGTRSQPLIPNAFESDQGWGGGTRPDQLIDGFRGCNGPGGWACGIAFTGGNADWGGQTCGVRQATIDLGSTPVQVSAVRITHHDDENVPKIYEIQSYTGGMWLTQVAMTDNTQSRCIRAPSYDPSSGWTCMITDEFAPVRATKVRYTFNNCPDKNSSILPGQSITHGWLWEFEVYRLPI